MTTATPNDVAAQGSDVDRRGRIKQLQANVVNQIAAGEVVQRPASALKELLENSVDAGSTQISVLVHDGGLKLLQVKDNGSGIHPADLPILCRRHTTSKISKYEDLASVGTLGFRGEALCSISFVARLSVVTMREGAELGCKAAFRDSEMSAAAPEPCAAVQGTCITVEDMFYNTPNRRKAMGSANDEFRRIFQVVAKYAVYCTGVGMVLKRNKQVKADVLTLPHFSRLDAVRAVYGSPIANNVVPFGAQERWPARHGDSPTAVTEAPMFSADGLIATANAVCKKTTLILFVNGRAVDCPPLKAALESVTSALHAKATFWAFLDVRMPAAHVDVNVHPTKAEVALLFQGELVEAVRGAAEAALAAAHDVRTFAKGEGSQVKSTLGGLFTQGSDRAGAAEASTQRAKAGGDHKLIRTDHRARSLKPFLQTQPSQASPPPPLDPKEAALKGSVRRKGNLKRNATKVVDGSAAFGAALDSGSPTQAEPNPALPDLAHLQALVEEVDGQAHTALTRVMREHIFVGHLDGEHVLLQQGSKLYMVNTAQLSRDLMFQQALRRHGQFRRIDLEPPGGLDELVMMGLESQEAAGTLTSADGSKEELRDMITELLLLKASVLAQTFGVTITSSRQLTTLPVLLDGYCPDVDSLPEFLIALAVDVEWSDDASICRDASKVLAELYHIGPLNFCGKLSQHVSQVANKADERVLESPCRREWILQNVVLPGARQHLKVPFTRATDGTVVQIAALEQLYKIFERC